MSMYPDDLDAIGAEIERFRRRLSDYYDALIAGTASPLYGCLRSAALRRASMDLTRALAELRDPNRRVQP